MPRAKPPRQPFAEARALYTRFLHPPASFTIARRWQFNDESSDKHEPECLIDCEDYFRDVRDARWIACLIKPFSASAAYQHLRAHAQKRYQHEDNSADTGLAIIHVPNQRTFRRAVAIVSPAAPLQHRRKANCLPAFRRPLSRACPRRSRFDYWRLRRFIVAASLKQQYANANTPLPVMPPSMPPFCSRYDSVIK